MYNFIHYKTSKHYKLVAPPSHFQALDWVAKNILRLREVVTNISKQHVIVPEQNRLKSLFILRRFYATWPLMYPYSLGTSCWTGYGFQGLASWTILFKTDRLQWSCNPKALGCIIITHPTMADVHCTVPLKSKLPITSHFLPYEYRITRYTILLVHNENRIVRESSNWKFLP